MAPERRLAAIVFTDLEGFTSEAHRDEQGALRLIDAQRELLKPILTAHNGREIKSMGDGLLLEFANARDAVEGAVALQQAIHERNAKERTPSLRMRVGIHLGDVEDRGDDILGDAVNIASRIEPLAETGGVCLTAQVYDQVRNKIPYQLERLGPKSVKGISESLEVYRVVLPWVARNAYAKASDLPRIAVLPFANISPDPRDEYFADGLTEELITILSQLQELRVISRTSVISYRTAPKPIATIGEELGVGAVLEGSVRKAGDMLRITVQLIDVATQEHRWAETYDRRLADIFAVQTEVARKVAGALRVKLGKRELDRLLAPREVAPESYLAYLRGRRLIVNSFDRRSLESAKDEFEEAIRLDPTNARAYAGLADATHYLALVHGVAGPAIIPQESRKLAARALEIDPDLAEAHSAIGLQLYNSLEWEAAEHEAKIALSLNPSNSTTRMWYADLLEEQLRTDEALRQLRLAKEADPQSRAVLGGLISLLTYLRRLDEAGAEIERLHELDPDGPFPHLALAYLHFLRSEPISARQELQRAEELPAEEGNPGPSFAIARLHALLGNASRARELLKILQGRPPTLLGLEGQASVYALLGDLDECFRILQKAVTIYGALAMQTYRLDPIYEPLRRDPRFADLLRAMKLA